MESQNKNDRPLRLPSDPEVLGLRRGPFLDAAERAEGPREYRVVAPSSRPRTGGEALELHPRGNSSPLQSGTRPPAEPALRQPGAAAWCLQRRGTAPPGSRDS
ncbi:hypothetical protein NDU88_002820 [Pleurodeles waltl]|uniref:Uncharacterized protein n=1 Tax=Pleurodeles waltl TaxID=8319 RepID=A0AAV7L4J3_PLEWA|nr:hypothetical protein NDU88_002820 [Pleurodeles waltl]